VQGTSSPRVQSLLDTMVDMQGNPYKDDKKRIPTIDFTLSQLLQCRHNRLFIGVVMIHMIFDYSVSGITYIYDTLDSSRYHESKKPD